MSLAEPLVARALSRDVVANLGAAHVDPRVGPGCRVAEVLVNRTTGHVVDGHLRIELALARKEPTVSVTYVELSEDEERLVLATLDPLAAMAEAEATKLAELLERLDPGDAALRALLDDLARDNDLASLRQGLVDPDDVPDLPEPADCYVQAGELWQLGDHRLL